MILKYLLILIVMVKLFNFRYTKKVYILPFKIQKSVKLTNLRTDF